MTDHGAQFVSSRTDKKDIPDINSGAFLEENGIKHILARVHYLQTRATEPLFISPYGDEQMGKSGFFGTVEAKKRFL